MQIQTNCVYRSLIPVIITGVVKPPFSEFVAKLKRGRKALFEKNYTIYCRFIFTPLENGLSCNSADTGVLSLGKSNTKIPLTLLPGLI